MTFEMPRLDRRQIDLLTKAALDRVCWELSQAEDNDPRWVKHVERLSAVYEAWVNYSRQTFPNEASGFMLDYERHHGAGIRFNSGDKWVFDETASSWTVVKPNGKRIVTRKPKK